MDGILPINKPPGITSYDVIRRVKRVLPRGVKIGHAGTLDPFAEGVLLLLMGKATKRFAEIQGWKKKYRAIAKVGYRSSTLDRDGVLTQQREGGKQKITQKEVQAAADKYLGEQEQTVPAYAAVKYRGRKLYEYAREGKRVPRKSKRVTIYSLEILEAGERKVAMRVECSSGTYIRQLSYDILRNLNKESYLVKLEREAVGKIKTSDCIGLVEVEKGGWEKRLL